MYGAIKPHKAKPTFEVFKLGSAKLQGPSSI